MKNHKKIKGVNPFRNKLKNQQKDKKPVIFKDFEEDDDQDEFLDNLVQAEDKAPSYHKLTKDELKARADEILEKQRKSCLFIKTKMKS